MAENALGMYSTRLKDLPSQENIPGGKGVFEKGKPHLYIFKVPGRKPWVSALNQRRVQTSRDKKKELKPMTGFVERTSLGKMERGAGGKLSQQQE